MSKHTVMVVFGTRPEAIKMAPVVRALQARPDRFETVVCVTAQHRQMLDQVLDVFDIKPDIDLNLMSPNQTLAGLTSAILLGMNSVFDARRPDCMLVQGDTTTTMAASLAAFYHRIPIGHVEAGLRTDNKYFPYPEEINRRLTTQMADLHFAPTERSRQNLLRDGVAPERAFVTGNTVIDALLVARKKTRGADLRWGPIDPAALEGRDIVAITGHRRENFGERFQEICRAILRLARQFPLAHFIYPVHLNPNVREPVHRILADQPNIHLIEPLDYLPFIHLMERSRIILTDSGGIQEEAPSLGKPVLVMRKETERPEAVDAGTVKLVGPSETRLVEEANRLLTDPEAYAAMSKAKNPFGDGTAAVRIADLLEEHLAEDGD